MVLDILLKNLDDDFVIKVLKYCVFTSVGKDELWWFVKHQRNP